MNGLRRLPLKIAGVIGIFTAAFYVAVLLGATGPVGPLEIVWVVMMFVGGVLAWTAPDTPVHGRRVAIAAAALFFVTGVLEQSVLVVIFLVALVLSILGFAGVGKPGMDD